jgi:uncharacterized phage-like protein YoqJ
MANKDRNVSSMIVAGTGHRPEDSEGETIVRTKARVKLQYTDGVSAFICGMASGFDLWAADEARLLGLEVIAAKPWAGHSPRVEDKDLYERILAHASRIVDVNASETYPGAWVYQKRNEWMVDNADVVMSYWSGKEVGGTWNCVKYARKVKKPMTNIYHSPPF